MNFSPVLPSQPTLNRENTFYLCDFTSNLDRGDFLASAGEKLDSLSTT